MFVIHNWDKFETNRTRVLKGLSWVPIPNDLSSDGYTELMEHEDGPAYFGVFIACVEVASKCTPRGTLVRRDGTPHDLRSLSRITRMSLKWMEPAFDALKRVGWIEETDSVPDERHHTGTMVPDGRQRKKERKNGKDRKKEGDSKHKAIFDLWFKLHQSRYQSKPLVTGAAPKVIKLLAGLPDGARILTAWYADDDPWIVKHGHSLQFLPARVDGVRASLGPAPTDISEAEAAKLVAEINERQNP